MGHFRIKKGLDIPIGGIPEKNIMDLCPVSRVALIANDYPGMKPLFSVSEGDKVILGEPLFIDKKNESIIYTSPGTGTVKSINRGEKRKFLSIEIDLDGDEEMIFDSVASDSLHSLNTEKIRGQLIKSGLWTSIKSRPFAKVADTKSNPDAIFVTAIDTRPLAPDPEIIINNNIKNFNNGLKVLSLLTQTVYLSAVKNNKLDIDKDILNIEINTFEGPHPAGLVGTQMHFVKPVYQGLINWDIDYQDVIAIGYLFTTGHIMTERVISLAGPCVKKPMYIKTRLGASINDIILDKLNKGNNRVISGSILYGHHAEAALSYLGRYHNQITVIPEGGDRPFMGWAAPGIKQYSVKNIFLSKFFNNKTVIFNTSLNGGHRPIVPIGSYEKVMPFDFEITYLLRALSTEDMENAEMLGALELSEEDLSLCTFVCPGKNDYSPMLRNVLDIIEKEG